MREAFRVVVYQFLSYGLQLAFMLWAARQLGPEAQGTYAILRTSSYLIETLMWMGLTSGASYFIARDFDRYHSPLMISAVAYVAGVVVISVPIVVVLLPRVFSVPIETGLLVLMWVTSLALLQLLMKVFLGQQRFDLYNATNIVTSIALYIPFGILIATHGISLHTVIGCNIFANACGLGLALFAHRRAIRTVRASLAGMRNAVVEFYTVGLKGYFSSVVFMLLFRADFFFVGHYAPRSLGMYSLAVFVVEAIQKVPDWLGLVLSPKVSAGSDASGDLTRKYLWSSIAFVCSVAVCLLLLRLFHVEYLTIPLGSGYRGVEAIVIALIPRAVLHSCVAIFGGRLAGSGYTLYHPLAGAMALAFLAILDTILIRKLGISGAVLGITASYVVAAGIMILGVHRVQPVRATA